MTEEMTTTIEGIAIYEPNHYTTLDDLIDANNFVAARVNYLREIKTKKYNAEKKHLTELLHDFGEEIKSKKRESRRNEKAKKEQKEREEEDRRQAKILLLREEYIQNLTNAIRAKSEVVNFETARNEFLILREFQKLNERYNLVQSTEDLESILESKWVDLLGKKYTFDEITPKIESLKRTIYNGCCHYNDSSDYVHRKQWTVMPENFPPLSKHSDEEICEVCGIKLSYERYCM